jgi:hypothetical protein
MVRAVPQFRQRGVEKSPEDVQCKKYACAFQRCLSKKNHNMDLCRGYFEAFEDCAANIRADLANKQQQQQE